MCMRETVRRLCCIAVHRRCNAGRSHSLSFNLCSHSCIQGPLQSTSTAREGKEKYKPKSRSHHPAPNSPSFSLPNDCIIPDSTNITNPRDLSHRHGEGDGDIQQTPTGHSRGRDCDHQLERGDLNIDGGGLAAADWRRRRRRRRIGGGDGCGGEGFASKLHICVSGAARAKMLPYCTPSSSGVLFHLGVGTEKRASSHPAIDRSTGAWV
jgi:hypothetical protein